MSVDVYLQRQYTTLKASRRVKVLTAVNRKITSNRLR